MKKVSIFFIVLIFTFYFSYSQKESWNWYFGEDAGITFLPDCKPKPDTLSNIGTWQGCATISDSAGNLLFYTDGQVVLNKNHVTMFNGYELYGGWSSTCSAIIIPRLGFAGQYYIFTIDYYERNLFGLRYSIVDMSLNGGLGDVTDKNIPMLDNVIEQLDAVYHQNDYDIWVVTYKGSENQYYAYLVTNTGISAPVKSPGMTDQSSGCYIKFSPDGKKMATTDGVADKFMLFDFDNATGKFSNPMAIQASGMHIPYGVEFSSDGTKLYGSTFNPSAIYQFDLTSGNQTDISNSAVQLASISNFYYWGALQMGPDKKIYSSVMDSKYLTVINDPDVTGAGCNLVVNGVYLTRGNGELGLPTFLQHYCYSNLSVTSNQPLCAGDSLVLKAYSPYAKNYKWTGPNGFSSTNPNPVIYGVSTKDTGTYNIYVTFNDTFCFGNDLSLNVHVKVEDIPWAKIVPSGPLSFCEGDSVKLTAQSPYHFAKWSTGELGPFLTVKKSGTYILTEFSSPKSKCADSDSVTVIVFPKVTAGIKALSPTSFCQGDSIILKSDSVDINFKYSWSTGSQDSQIVVKKPGVYKLIIENGNACKDSTTISVTVNPNPDFKIKTIGKPLLCKDDSVALGIVPVSSDFQYMWSTGDTSSQIAVYKEGVYFATVTNKYGCSSVDSISVLRNNLKARITVDGSLEFCFGDSVILTGTPFGKEFSSQWSNGASSQSIIVKVSGRFIYLVTDSIGCTASDTIDIKVNSGLQAKIIGNDEFCQGDSILLLANPSGSSYKYLWSNGETTNWIYASKPGNYWVLVSLNNNCADTANITLSMLPKPLAQITLQGYWPFCRGDSILLNAYPRDSGNTFKWSDGETAAEIIVKDSGNYYCVVTNSYGCSDTAGYLFVPIFDKPSVKIRITGSTSFCKGDSVILTAVSPDSGLTYKWNTGDTTQSIVVRQGGFYKVKVTLSDLCTATDSVLINITDALQPIIAGDSLFCPGMTDILVCQPDFASYSWSTGETTKQITVSQPGNYSVTVTDSIGCTGSAKININNYDIKLTGIQDLLFGIIPLGSSDTLSLTIKNESNTDINIKNIHLLNNSTEFVIVTNPTLPATLAINQTIDVIVKFTPQENKQYSDSLIFEIDLPCQTYFNSFITGETMPTAPGETFVWLPDTTGNVGAKDFCIPLQAIVTKSFVQTGNLGYSARIKFDATAFLPDSIYSNYILNGVRYIEMSDNNVIFTNNSAKLGEFCGQILLAREDVTPFYIDNFQWSFPDIETAKKNGSLTITGICARDIARIKLIDQTLLDIIYSLNRDEIKAEICLPATENIKLELFDALGNFTNVIYQGKLDKGNYEIVFPQQLPSGLHFARLRTNRGETVTKGFMITR